MLHIGAGRVSATSDTLIVVVRAQNHVGIASGMNVIRRVKLRNRCQESIYHHVGGALLAPLAPAEKFRNLGRPLPYLPQGSFSHSLLLPPFSLRRPFCSPHSVLCTALFLYKAYHPSIIVTVID